MQSFVRFLMRLLLVPLGGAVAIIVANIIVVAAHRGEIVALAQSQRDDQGWWVIGLLFIWPVLFSFAVLLTAVPAALGALIAEGFAFRSWIYHVLNGGLSALLGWTQMDDIGAQYRFLAEPKIMVAAGLAGGFAYWGVAGWSAGFWKPVFPPPTPPPAPAV